MKLIKPKTPLKPEELISFLMSLYPDFSCAGTPPAEIKMVCPVDSSEACSESLSFIRTKDPNQVSKAIASSGSCSFFISSQVPGFAPPAGKWILIVPDPQVAYIMVQDKFFLDKEKEFLPDGIHKTAIIDVSAKVSPTARIGAYAVIGAHCVIEDHVIIHPHVVLYNHALIGKGSVLHSHTVIREHSVIGPGCTIQPGAVIGSDGFGYVQDPTIGIRAVPQVGTVEISANVDIGSNSCIDRAAHGKTRIGTGSKLDNLVQVGHNVEIESHAIVCGQVGIGGSSKIGSGVVLGGQVGVGDHMKIASGVRIGGAGVVISHVEEPGDYMGYPVQHAFKWRRILAAQLLLPDLLKKMRKKQD